MSRTKALQELDFTEYVELKNRGMLYEFYPEATGDYNKDCIHARFEEQQDKLDEATEKSIEVELSAWNCQEGGNHYKDMGIQPLELTLKNRGYEAFAGACYTKINKYIGREKENFLQDLKKARHVLNMWIEVVEEKENK